MRGILASPTATLLHREGMQREGEGGARLVSRNMDLDAVLQRWPVDLAMPVAPEVFPAWVG